MKINNLRPMLEVANIKQTVEFYTNFLGFECGDFFPNQAEACWVCLFVGDVEIMFTTKNAHSTGEKPTLTGSLYLNVENADEWWEKLKNKVEIVYPIENFDFGMREFAIKDCNGYILNIGQEIAN